MEQTILTVEGVRLKYPQQLVNAIDDVSFSLDRGDILALLGPSGCGKTTLLRLIAGFEQPQQGSITIGSEVISTPSFCLPTEQRHIGIVFQDYALFPHLTVRQNVAFGIKGKYSNPDREVKTALERVGLQNLTNQYPHQLSGGQQQRVALARALITNPLVVLLDEPLSNIDVQLRLSLRSELKNILKSFGTTALWVTHDQEEAMAVADWIGVMEGGKLSQWGTPKDIYCHPKNHFVAAFVSQANLLPIHTKGDQISSEIGDFPCNGYTKINDRELMIRPEDITLIPDPESLVIIHDRVFLGREWLYHLQLPSGREMIARASAYTPALEIGSPVKIHVSEGAWQLI